MKIDCNIIKDLLPLYSENMVSKESSILIEDHINECPSCKAELDTLKDGVKAEKEIKGNIAAAAPIKKIKKAIHRKLLLAIIIPVILGLSVIGIFLFKSNSHEVKLDIADSEIYSVEEREAAINSVIQKFEDFNGCKLYSLTYAGDQKSNMETEYLNDGRKCIDIDSSFRSPIFGGGGWDSNEIYTWHWVCAQNTDGSWEVVNYGYC